MTTSIEQKFEEWDRSSSGIAVDLVVSLGIGAIGGAVVFPMFQPGLSTRDAALEGAAISGVIFAFRRYRMSREG